MRIALVILVAICAVPSSSAMGQSKSSEVRERVNKVWDDRLNRMLQAKIQADCRAEAEKAYSAIRFKKRRTFVEECVQKASVPAPAQATHQVY